MVDPRHLADIKVYGLLILQFIYGSVVVTTFEAMSLATKTVSLLAISVSVAYTIFKLVTDYKDRSIKREILEIQLLQEKERLKDLQEDDTKNTEA